MRRFPLVQSLDQLNPIDFQDPGARVAAEDVVGEIKIDDQLSGLLLSEAESGRPVALTVLVVRRLDGVFIVAGALAATAVAKEAPKPAPDVQAALPVPAAAKPVSTPTPAPAPVTVSPAGDIPPKQ